MSTQNPTVTTVTLHVKGLNILHRLRFAFIFVMESKTEKGAHRYMLALQCSRAQALQWKAARRARARQNRGQQFTRMSLSHRLGGE